MPTKWVAFQNPKQPEAIFHCSLVFLFYFFRSKGHNQPCRNHGIAIAIQLGRDGDVNGDPVPQVQEVARNVSMFIENSEWVSYGKNHQGPLGTVQ